MKNYTKKTILLFATFISALVCFGQAGTDTSVKNDPGLFKKDFMIYRDSLEKIHPALYWYRSKKEMDHLFDSCYATINESTTELRFFMLLRFLTAAVEDGHLVCSLPRSFVMEQLNTVPVFPLRLWFIDGKAFVYCDNDKRIAAGTEIVSIDNTPINDIRKKLFQYIGADAKIQSKKYQALNAGEGSFSFMYYWLEGAKPNFKVAYKGKSGDVKMAMIDAAIIKGNACVFEKKKTDKYLSLTLDEGSIATLTIKTFAMGKLNADESYFKTYLDSVFNQIKEHKIKKLIVDVRDNGGGLDENGSLLYSYLTDKPFAYYSSLQTISAVLPKSIHSNLEIQQPSVNNFKGTCYFLTNGKSFSTTSEFCAIAKSNNRGKFIGEETAGGYYGNTGSEEAKFELPYSKISLVIHKRKYILAVKKTSKKDGGVVPDYRIIPTINDVLENKDVQLDYALKLAAGKK